MSKQIVDFSSSEFSTTDTEDQVKESSATMRNALLVAGASAIAFGLWRRDRIGWPAVIGGSALLARGAVQKLPRESSCEVSQTIYRSPSEIFSYLREVKNWPAFMKPMKDDGPDNFYIGQQDTIHWSEGSRQWTGKITGSSESSLQWRSKSDGQVRECSIEWRPAPGDRGTEVRWRLRSKTPIAFLPELFRTGAGDSDEQMARESLRALKQLLEAGELATTDGQPHGDRGTKGKIERDLFHESRDEKRRGSQSVIAESQQAAS
jgi:uncharacterized membrane protein